VIPTTSYDVVVVGAGIVGLATARALLRERPGLRLAVLDKEPQPARHQSGRNSGVIHAGLYYRPGSEKARLCVEGNRRMVAYCAAHSIPHEVCGKTIVATSVLEEERLAVLEERAGANGVLVERLSPTALREREPHAAGRAALHVPSTGITDFRLVSLAYARDVEEAGGELLLGRALAGAEPRAGGLRLATSDGPLDAAFLVNCAGLHSDRVAAMCGATTGARIVPFRGEYYRLTPAARSLVRHLLYPVPDPDLPFLGVHLHRHVDGEVSAGPNAVLAGDREAYERGQLSPGHLGGLLVHPGFWRMAARMGWTGLAELVRARSQAAFLRAARHLLPELRADHLAPHPAGIRAQALDRSGRLIDDFLFTEGERSLHVVNAPSPAATASLVIGEEVAGRVR
jgi:L-2-hydroxyglutarate oxidase LhgO